MRAAWSIGLALLFASGQAAGKDPAPPRPEADAADAVVAAVAGADRAALEALAEADDPDPWWVADELLARGAAAAAHAFATAAPRPTVARLPDYVAAARERDVEAPARARLLTAIRALEEGQDAAALAALEGLAPAAPGVLAVRVHALRAQALRAQGRIEASGGEAAVAAAMAEELGWTGGASWLWMEAGKDAFDGGDFVQARERWRRGLAQFEAQSDDLCVAHTLGNLGLVEERLQGQVTDSLAMYERAARLFGEHGATADQAAMLSAVGLAHMARGDYPAARVALERALERHEALGNLALQGGALCALGSVRAFLGEPAEGLAAQVEARRLLEQAGDARGVLQTVVNAGAILQQRGDFPAARERFEEVLALAQAAEAPDYEARAHGYLGALAARLGDYGRALQELGKARRTFEELRDRDALASVLGQLGEVRRLLGEYVEALRLVEQAQRLFEAVGNRAGVARMRGAIGNVYVALGDHGRALPLLEEELAGHRRSGHRAAEAHALLGLCGVQTAMGRPGAARESAEKALGVLESLGDRPGTARAHAHRAEALRLEGRLPEALAALERSQALYAELKDRAGVVVNLLTQAQVRLALGEPQQALGPLEQARTEARRLGALELIVGAHALLAQARLALGNAELALETARGASQYLDSLARGQGEEHGASARAKYADLYEAGASAGAALGDAAESAYWLETGRAGTLLEALGGRDALLSATVSEALRAGKARADEREAGARRAYYDALEGSDVEARRAARAALDAALDEVRGAVERITRESKTEAGVLYPKAAPLEEIRAWLAPGEALVEYGMLSGGAVALVLTADEERVVRLGAREAVLAACEDLTPSQRGADVREAVRALSALVVAPLALDASVTRVLISPDGALSYVPFALLLPEREIAYVPSGTTLGALLAQASGRGAGVLALGDPDYSTHRDARAAEVLGAGRSLKPLPHTRAEAEAVGDRVLLGKDATVAGLKEALAERPRWRALHLACHGLVDPRRPLLSSLALAAGEGDDGYLTALEVCQQPFAADLAVLSACDTGRGKVVRGEGIVGLTRAFMFAGAPRVLCSLWKVDDEATAALMTRFYELWKDPDAAAASGGGSAASTVSAARALREAQRHVAAQPRWSHPHYWAAWVLWGVAR